MNERTFDALTRRGAAGISRRTSLLTLGALGLATLAHPAPSDAAKNTKKRKRRKKSAAREQEITTCQEALAECSSGAARCADQVGPCSTFLTASCAGKPNCIGQAACCPLLERCDVEGFLGCLVTVTI